MERILNRLNQQHGIWFEDFVRETNGCLGIPRLDGPFDIPAEYNREFGVPESVKTVRETPNGNLAKVGLASAPRFAAITTAYQMVVGVHRPVSGGKMFHEVRTYVVSKDMHKKLLGNLGYEELMQFDAWVKHYRRDTSGDVMARDYALKTRDALMNRRGRQPLVEIAYKINEGNRRIQLELDLVHLHPALVRVDDVYYRGTALPLLYRPGV